MKKTDYSKTKEQWITRFDAKAAAAKAAKDTPKYTVEEAQAILRKLALFAASGDPKDLPVLPLLKKKGVDGAYFGMFTHYNDRLTALSLAGAADPRVEIVVSPSEKKRVEEIYQVFSALRGAAGDAGEAVGHVEDAKPVGRGVRVVHTPQGVLDGIQQFLTNANLVEELLEDATIGEEELTELQGFVTELQAMIATKEARQETKGNRAGDIELALLAIDAAIALYKSRSKTATRHKRELLPRAFAAFPRAPERRKPAAPPDTNTDAKSDTKADAKTETKTDAKSESAAETSSKPAAPPAVQTDSAPAPAAAASAP